MEKNYIILAHENPQQLLRLIKALDDNKSFFYIHVDKKVDIQDFKELISDYKNVIFVTNRYECIWGSISLVYATLSCMSKIINDRRSGYCILMSGQDYPIKSRESIDEYFDNNNDFEFIDIKPIKECWPDNKWVQRYEYYTFYLSSKRQDSISIPYLFSKEIYNIKSWKLIFYKIAKTKDINLVFEIITNIIRKRKHPEYIIPYGGAQWWALTIPTIKEILDFVHDNVSFVSYHRYTAIPDEVFFHTIIMYLATKNRGIKIKPSLTYTNWERKNVPLPVTFCFADLYELINLPIDKLFARKFNIHLDEKILDEIDDNVLLK
jgi:hypothetical protein